MPWYTHIRPAIETTALGVTTAFCLRTLHRTPQAATRFIDPVSLSLATRAAFSLGGVATSVLGYGGLAITGVILYRRANNWLHSACRNNEQIIREEFTKALKEFSDQINNRVDRVEGNVVLLADACAQTAAVMEDFVPGEDAAVLDRARTTAQNVRNQVQDRRIQPKIPKEPPCGGWCCRK
jgi:hypothetical protein